MEALIIRDERGRLSPMKFSDSQELLWTHIAPKLDRHEKIWMIVLKARQTYASTFTQALTFIRTLEQSGTNSLVLAQDLHTSHQLFAMAKRFYDNLPLPQIKPPRVTELEFPMKDGTSIYRVVSAGSMAKGRGTTQSCVHASEAAFWPHPEILDGLFQAMPDLPDTMWILESTANGMVGKGEMFFNLWNASVRGESDLEPVFIAWWKMPKYRRKPGIPQDDWDKEERMLVEQFDLDGEQLAWRRRAIMTKCRGSIDTFKQEYPASPEEAFIASGQPAFDVMTILEQRPNIVPAKLRLTVDAEDGSLMVVSKGEIRVWKEPEEGRQYVIGADTAEGLSGGDYSCGIVLDMASMEQVASVHGRIQYHEFAILLNALGRYYNTALLAIEVYPQGFTVQDKLLRNHHYPMLHMWKGKPDRVRHNQRSLYGWETNIWSRPLLIAAGQRALNHGLVTLHEDGLLNELMRFSKNDDGKYEAAVGHDDRVLALLIALRSREENYWPARESANLSEPILPHNLRVAAYRDPTYDAARRTSNLLRRVKDATKSWMAF